MTAATADRPVRVTIEGTARPVKHDPRYLIVRTADDAPVLVNTQTLGVTVEDIAPARQWTDGDVVQNHVFGWTLTRDRSLWVLSTDKAPWEDTDVTEALDDPTDPYHGQMLVLRCRAGER